MAIQIPLTNDFERPNSEQAARVIERWRERGFDIVLCHPSGYCSPANSTALTTALRDGYCAVPVDSADALEAIERSIASGMTYRV